MVRHLIPLLKTTFSQVYLLLKFSALLYLTKWNSENLPARPPFCRESQWEISSTRPPLSPLWVWYEIPENSFRNAKDSKRSRRWRVLCSEAPLSTKGLSLSLIPSSCKPELIVHRIGSIFYCSLKSNFWLFLFYNRSFATTGRYCNCQIGSKRLA